ncbi:hypothetical protein QJE79_003789 [Salmonella enterica]|nr:hypothetical protein [Salmonella enterica]ELD5411332.1 hypothetical protein [Salmonella enterica]
MSEIPWYLGQYDRRNYQSYLKAVAQDTPHGWRTIDNPKKLFPRTGEVEFNEADALPLRKGEWAAFQVGPGGRNRAQAKRSRRIYPYYDLSSGQSLLEARRRLSFDGITTGGEPGLWAIRFGPDGLILANMTELTPDRFVLSRNQNIPEYAFNECGIINVSGLSENGKVFYMPDVDVSPCRIHDWTPDKHYIENAVRLIADTGSSLMIASWLREHADEQNGKSKSGADNLLAAAQALRSGELARKLEEETSLARELAEAVLYDGNIAALLKRQIQNIAEEEREALRAEQQMTLETVFSAERRQRRDALEAEMAAFQTTARNEIEQKIAQFRQREEEKLQADFAEKQANIEQTLNHEKARLESEIDGLKDTGADLCVQNENQRQMLASLTREREAFSASLMDIGEQTARAQAELEQINAAMAEKARRMAYSAIPEVRLPPEAKTVSCNEFGRCVRENKLLTPDGKTLMVQFLALMLAGECPLLSGPETQDFIAIAESLISSGRSIRQIADPTMISCEDLWVRAGNHLATPLYQGLLLSEASRPRTILAVIERVECSAARFWLPALKGRLRGGDFPRRFLICGTIENEDDEEAEKIKEQHLHLRMENVVIQNAIALSPLHLSLENHRELDPGAVSQDSPLDKLAVADEMSAGRLDLANTLQAMRAAHEAALFDDENKAMHQKRLVDLYADLQNNELCAH